MGVVVVSFVLVCLAIVGLPLFVVLGAGALAGASGAGLDPAVLIVEMMRLAASPNLIAIPLFVLTGVVLATGGAPARLIRVFNAAFGWMPAGLALVTALVCMFFTAFSGASGVTILALGGLLYPMLISEGYGKRFSLGLITSCGSMGLLLPPSLVVFLYAIVAQVSIEQLFVAGMVPTILLFALVGLFSLYTQRSSVIRHPFNARALIDATRAGLGDLLLPAGVLGGLLGGYLTVTEMAACAATYALVLEVGIYRNLTTWAKLRDVINESAILVGSIFIILGVSMGLTNLLVDAQVPAHLMSLLETHISSPTEFLLLLNVFLLFIGCMMDIFSAIMVVVPLLLPIAYRFGVDPIHLGIIILANLEIGYITPPVGINLFIAGQRFNEPIFTLFRSALPFLGIMILWLLIITYIPGVTLWWK